MNRRTMIAQGIAQGSVALLSACATGGATRAPKASTSANDTFWTDRLPQLMEYASVPGVAVAMVEGGAVAWARGFGVRAAGGSDPIAEDTVFEAASLGKPVFAYAVLRMRDEGLIDLDRPLGAYLPAPYLPDEPKAAAITARHVLSHSSGFRNWRNGPTDRLTVDFTPGERFSYSGEGYFYLQRVVEQVAGRAFPRYVRERVLEPLGMRSSSYVWLPELDARMAAPHSSRGQPRESFHARLAKRMAAQAPAERVDTAAGARVPLLDWRYDEVAAMMPKADPNLPVLPNYMIPNAAGSLLTTAGDYARFVTHVVDGGARGATDLAEGTRREMLSPQIRLNSALAWGLGWGLEREGGAGAPTSFWHWGDNGNYKNFVLGDAAARRAVAIFTNGAGGLKVAERIVNHVTGREHPAFVWV
ncbi:MAG TPA: serine hydrolase domain-containing protein [Gemmatimonadaceae bacterium]|nr:serine hydrolase domain-containing protein [Gemmatimonadaceae bacterium]